MAAAPETVRLRIRIPALDITKNKVFDVGTRVHDVVASIAKSIAGITPDMALFIPGADGIGGIYMESDCTLSNYDLADGMDVCLLTAPGKAVAGGLPRGSFRTSRAATDSISGAAPLFGVPLNELEASRMRNGLPIVVSDAFGYFADKGFAHADLFDAEAVNEALTVVSSDIKPKYEIGLWPDLRGSAAPPTVMALLLSYLRSLPGALIPSKMARLFVATLDCEEAAFRLGFQRALVRSLTPPHMRLLRDLAAFLQEVAKAEAHHGASLDTIVVRFLPLIFSLGGDLDDDDDDDGGSGAAGPSGVGASKPLRGSTRQAAAQVERLRSVCADIIRYCEILFEDYYDGIDYVAVAQAKSAFAGDQEHELPLAEGAVIFITFMDKNGWWEGMIGDAIGVFPVSCVRVLVQFDEASLGRKSTGKVASMRVLTLTGQGTSAYDKAKEDLSALRRQLAGEQKQRAMVVGVLAEMRSFAASLASELAFLRERHDLGTAGGTVGGTLPAAVEEELAQLRLDNARLRSRVKALESNRPTAGHEPIVVAPSTSESSPIATGSLAEQIAEARVSIASLRDEAHDFGGGGGGGSGRSTGSIAGGGDDRNGSGANTTAAGSSEDDYDRVLSSVKDFSGALFGLVEQTPAAPLDLKNQLATVVGICKTICGIVPDADGRIEDDVVSLLRAGLELLGDMDSEALRSEMNACGRTLAGTIQQQVKGWVANRPRS